MSMPLQTLNMLCSCRDTAWATAHET